MRLSSEAEEYVEAVFRLEEAYGVARTMDLVRVLRVSPGSVTNTLGCLEKRGLVVRKPYRGVKLTDEGRRVALKILRKHRLAERLLTDFLKMPWSDVHEVACRLEHAMDDELASAIDKALGRPEVCPHGSPIPSSNGTIKQQKAIPLTRLEANRESVVVRITDEEREKLRFLARQGLKPGVTVSVVEQKPSAVKISVFDAEGRSRRTVALKREVASTIWVKQLKGET